ncbi:MAG: ABC transporter substrate-binding protein [Chloroflexota bacterium]
MSERLQREYGIKVNGSNPGAGSDVMVEPIKASKDNPGPQAPDVIDVGLSFGPSAKADGLIKPYKVATWDEIPDSVKDAEQLLVRRLLRRARAPGRTLDRVQHADVVRRPAEAELRGARSPCRAVKTSPTERRPDVYASSLANGGSLDDASKGVDFWKQVMDAKNFVPTIANATTIDQEVPPRCAARWSYNALSHRDSAATQGTDIAVTLPTDSPPFAGVYVQAIGAYAPHPNAAKLWMEYLYSDEARTSGSTATATGQHRCHEGLGRHQQPAREAAGRDQRGVPDARAARRGEDPRSRPSWNTVVEMTTVEVTLLERPTSWPMPR